MAYAGLEVAVVRGLGHGGTVAAGSRGRRESTADASPNFTVASRGGADYHRLVLDVVAHRVMPFVIAALAGSLMLASIQVSPAAADVLGGGIADVDCRAGFSGVDATERASGVVCVDGDLACDLDGIADGQCRFTVSACAGLVAPGCDTVELDDIAIAGLAIVPPRMPAREGCGEPLEVRVDVGEAKGATLIARSSREVRDVDYLTLCCVSEADPLAGVRCAALLDADVSGCANVPRKATRGLAKARTILGNPGASDAAGRRAARKAKRQFKRVRNAGRAVAESSACGFSLGLVGTHGLEVAGDALQ
jgi:hypothetical protein